MILSTTLIFALLAFYFVPSIVANNKYTSINILLFNLFFGWTVVGWIVALAWALYVEKIIPKSSIRTGGSTEEDLFILANMKDRGLLTIEKFNIQKQKLVYSDVSHLNALARKENININ